MVPTCKAVDRAVPRCYPRGMSDDGMTAVNLRLPTATLKRLDEYVANRNATGNGARISRNAAIAVLLGLALDQEGTPAPKPKKPAKAGK